MANAVDIPATAAAQTETSTSTSSNAQFMDITQLDAGGSSASSPEHATGGEICGPSNVDVSTAALTAKDLEKVADLPVLDKDAKSQTFKSLVQVSGVERHLVVMIRHWFCRVCQGYVLRMSESMPPSSLPPATRVTIIGCGGPEVIETYANHIDCPFPVYTDPTGNLYKALGMGKTLNGGKIPDYMRESVLTSVIKSITFGFSAGKKAFAAGDIKQIGGEMLFRVGSHAGENGWRCDFIHRMRSTRDHLEIPQLMELIDMREGGEAGSKAT